MVPKEERRERVAPTAGKKPRVPARWALLAQSTSSNNQWVLKLICPCKQQPQSSKGQGHAVLNAVVFNFAPACLGV